MNTCSGHGASGRDRGALNVGEARTLLGMIAGISPEPVEGFLVITMLKCPECGEGHMLTMDRDIDIEDALTVLQSALGLMVLARMRREATGIDDIYGEN